MQKIFLLDIKKLYQVKMLLLNIVQSNQQLPAIIFEV